MEQSAPPEAEASVSEGVAGDADGADGRASADADEVASVETTAPQTPPPAASTSWREAAGRAKGDDGYRFGDATRSLYRKVACDDDDTRARARQGGRFHPARRMCLLVLAPVRITPRASSAFEAHHV